MVKFPLLKLPEIKGILREEMEAIENRSYFRGASPAILMDRAGKGIAEYVLKKYAQEKILILISTGNNGGDGLITALELYNAGRKVSIIKLSRKQMNSQEGRNAEKKVNGISEIRKMVLTDCINQGEKNCKKAEEYTEGEMQECISSRTVKSSWNSISFENYKEELLNSKLVLDAIFGVKLNSKLRKPFDSYIQALSEAFPEGRENRKKKTLIAIDIPSGLDSNTGKWLGRKLYPDITLTFQYSKRGLLERHLKFATLDIGIDNFQNNFSHFTHFTNFWVERDVESHKGENGRVMVLGGSEEFTGAPVLATKAILRVGVDTVRTVVPKGIRDIVAGYSENFLVVTPRDSAGFTLAAVDYLAELAIDRHQTIVIGMGASSDSKVGEFIRKFIEECARKITTIIDADGIRAFKNRFDLLKGTKAILTPHKAELAFLLQQDLPLDFQELISKVEYHARKLEVIFVVKGKTDIITDGNRTFLNQTGHEGMTVGGTGDVLAGVIAAATCFVKERLFAALIGTYIMGKAGEKAAEKYGNSLLATDIIQMLPDTLSELEKKRNE